MMGTMKDSSQRARIRILSFFVLLGGLVSVGQLYRVQIVRGDAYANKADRQLEQPAASFFDRGSIYFTTKDGDTIAAATTRQGYTLAISPRDVLPEKRDEVYEKLNAIVPIDREVYDTRITKANDPYEELATRLTRDQQQAIQSLKIKGVSMSRTSWRFYPGGSLAAHVLGFISPDDDHRITGKYGLEKQYEEVLSRTNDAVFVNFFVELFSNVKDVVSGNNREGDLITTIEPSVQEQAEKVIVDIQAKYSSKQTGIIVMDPYTGEIRAMAHVPTYDINSFNAVDDYAVYRNPLVEDRFEMGSIVKPLTVAAGLDAGAINANTTFNDMGSLTLNGRTFYNFDKQVRGVVDMQEVLNNSLNTGVAFIVSKIGNTKFGTYLISAFEERTGIDLPGEAESQLANLNSGRDLEYAQASFGQGIAMSAVSITRALAALGNGGVLVRPHIVSKVKYTMGLSETVEQPEPERIFSAQASEEISRMLVAVVDEALLGGQTARTGYSVAAKTGTAQMAKENGGGYYEDRYLHSFFGYFPAYKPQFIVFLYTVDPRGEAYASHTLTAPFVTLTDFLINYYQIPPDRDTSPKTNETLP